MVSPAPVDPLDPPDYYREGATLEHVTVTPALAAGWLESARSVEGENNEKRVTRYAEIMAAGRWRDWPDATPITFDGGGRVRYGIQRLEACVRAGVPFPSKVVRWPLEAADVYEADVAAVTERNETFDANWAAPFVDLLTRLQAGDLEGAEAVAERVSWVHGDPVERIISSRVGEL